MPTKKKNHVDKSAIVAAQSQAFLKGTAVWVPSESAGQTKSSKANSTWIRGVVEGVTRGTDDEVVLNIILEDGKPGQCKAAECFLQNEKDDTVDDLVRSDFLHEPGILHTLRARYELDMIYTYSGQILIAVNPHKSLNHLYGERMMDQYKDIPFGDLSPHTYAVAEAAYSTMMIDENRQAILISGESGAGKTESAKMVMQYLAHRSGSSFGDPTVAAAPIEQQILESNPLLEAFGNAKTARNDNSSRFGKFVEIDFDMTGRIIGASISTYLLERSRVVSVAPTERSFHIFYQLCSGSNDDMKERLFLPPFASGFAYLAQSDTVLVDGIDDNDGFARTLQAMSVIGLDNDQIDSVLKCVSAILHLGNINFETANNARADEAVVCPDASSTSSLKAAADLLGASPEALQKALMSRIITIGGEKIEKRFTVLESIESRDSLAKSLYSRLFDWLVSAVNKKIGSVGGGKRTNLSVGILDIYGFESFETNSFEQLCINLANEKLQQAFNAHIFKAEQNEYTQEGIDWSYIEFIDNQDVLDILEGTCLSDITKENLAERNMGVFPMIDEACRLPRATSQDLATTLRSKLEKHPRFSAPKRDQYSFVINHYAGEVRYVVDHLLEKNRDFKVEDQESLMRTCNSPLPANLYPECIKEGIKSSFKLNTIGSTFRTQLNVLSETLNRCQPHFIRCIKPNESSSPGNLRPAYAMEQLRAGGVLEAVRIACAGYPTRKLFFPFVQRYLILVSQASLRDNQIPLTSKGVIDWSALSEGNLYMLTKMIIESTDLKGWQIGKTRIFLRTGQLAVLEGLRSKALTNAAVLIQKKWRGYVLRKRMILIINSAAVIQAAWRSHVQRMISTRILQNHAATIIQAVWRMLLTRRNFIQVKMKKQATVIQSYWRMYMARKEFIKKSEFLQQIIIANDVARKQSKAATTIQAYWRRSMAIAKFRLLHKNSLKVHKLLRENESLKNELKSWREKCAVLDTELNLWKSRENAFKSNNSIEPLNDANSREMVEMNQIEQYSTSILAQETVDALQNEIRILKDALDESYIREELRSDVISKERDKASRLETEVDDLKIHSNGLEDSIVDLQMKLAESKTINQVHEDTIACLKQSETLKTEELCASTSMLEELKEELSKLTVKISEQNRTISGQENEIAVLSSRIESLLGQVQSIEREKAELSLKLVQVKGEITEISGGKKNDNGASVLLQSSTNETNPSSDSVHLNTARSEILELLKTVLINQKPVYILLYNEMPGKGIYLPFSSWILRNCFNYWVDHWRKEDLDLAVAFLGESWGHESQKNMTSCVNSINAICATGAMLKVDAVGRKNSSMYAGISDKLMGQNSIYKSLAAFVSKKVPINVSTLLTEDARRSARNNYLKQDSRNFEDRLDVMGSAKVNWKSIIGSLTNLSLALQEDKLPMPLVKSVLWATMRYIDGSILNGILMRRDLCSVSSAKALLTALGILENYITSLPGGPEITTQEYRESFQRVTQAAHFIIEGFDDCSRKARSGVGIRSSILKCSALTLQQIYWLAESQHDDWLGGASSVGSERKTLLEALKSMLEDPEEERKEIRQKEDHVELEQSWVLFGNTEKNKDQVSAENFVAKEDIHNLLVDPLADFNLTSKGFHRRQMILSSKMYFQVNDAASNADTLHSTVFSKIEEVCGKVPIPEPIRSCPELNFLTT